MIQKRTLLLAILFLTAASVAFTQAQDNIIKSEAGEVWVDVLVTNKGKPIEDLGASDFEVFDNGVLQKIEYAEPQRQMPVSATLVFDMSDSVAGKLLNYLKDAANGLLADLEKEDRAALITFNHTVVLGSPLTHDIERIKRALNQAQSRGRSSLIDASYAGLLLAESRSRLPLLIIFSDGFDTFSWLTAEAVLETAKRTDAVVYAVSTKLLPEKSFLGNLAELTAGSLIEVESTENLPAEFLRILEEFRRRYIVTYIPQGVSDSGWHKLEVRVKRRSAKVLARAGYTR